MTSSGGPRFMLRPFGRAGACFIRESTAFLNIAVGSIRSGKTIAAIVRFLAFMMGSPHTSFAMAGKTITALRRNVVEPFLMMLNTLEIPYTYNKSQGEILFLDNHISLFGIDKEGADEKIKGFTCAGSLVDEITVMPQSGFEMLLSRNSLSGAKVFCTCNPGSPLNYVYTEYVDNKELLESGRCRVFDFLLEDNPNLSEEYVENIRNMYAKGSVFYKRNILNQWVSGQGAIFDSFTDDNILRGRINLDDYYKFGVGSDYGVSTTTCYSIIGFKRSESGVEYHLIREYAYNAEREGVGQSDDERVDDIIGLQDEYNFDRTTTFHVSHDAENLRIALEKSGRCLMNLNTFMPDTLQCIQRMSQLFNENRLLIHESCVETIKQVRGYEWDLKASQKGLDRPVKRDDHLVDSMRAPLMTDLLGHKLLGGVVHL